MSFLISFKLGIVEPVKLEFKGGMFKLVGDMPTFPVCMFGFPNMFDGGTFIPDPIFGLCNMFGFDVIFGLGVIFGLDDILGFEVIFVLLEGIFKLEVKLGFIDILGLATKFGFIGILGGPEVIP